MVLSFKLVDKGIRLPLSFKQRRLSGSLLGNNSDKNYAEAIKYKRPGRNYGYEI